jgi:hypothetical protein
MKSVYYHEVYKVSAMGDWKIYYRDHLDQDRTSPPLMGKEIAIEKARDLYHHRQAHLYRIEGPDGVAMSKREVNDLLITNRADSY